MSYKKEGAIVRGSWNYLNLPNWKRDTEHHEREVQKTTKADPPYKADAPYNAVQKELRKSKEEHEDQERIKRREKYIK